MSGHTGFCSLASDFRFQNCAGKSKCFIITSNRYCRIKTNTSPHTVYNIASTRKSRYQGERFRLYFVARSFSSYCHNISGCPFIPSILYLSAHRVLGHSYRQRWTMEDKTGAQFKAHPLQVGFNQARTAARQRIHVNE